GMTETAIATVARAITDAELPPAVKLPDAINPLADGIFMRHQRQWLEDRSPLKICDKARRTGITFASAWDDTLTAASAPSAGGQNCFYIGDTKEKGLEYIGYVRHFAKCIGEQLLAFEEFLFEDRQDDGETKYITAYRARFASGFRVEALASRPANIRGLQGRVTIDEAAFHQNVRAVIAAANALLIWGGEVRIISTHNGVNSPFNQLVKEAEAGRSPWKLHTYTFDDAVANGLYERVCLKTGKTPTPEGKKEWYDLIRGSYGTNKDAEHEELDVQPAEGEGAWLTYDVITACEDELAGKPELYAGGPCTIGNDIARRGDLWVAWVWEHVGDVRWCREIVALRSQTFAAHDAEIARLMARYQVVRLVMDQTGMGEKPVEDMKRAYGAHRVEGVVFNAMSQLNVATAAKQAFEDKKARIPAGDVELRADLHKLKRVAGPTGAPRLVAESDASGHADRFWAAALGLAGGTPEPAIIDFYRRQAEARAAKQTATA
ncbi:MAG: hypothetical protein ACREED_05160, partial [Stellaceae bacterium]